MSTIISKRRKKSRQEQKLQLLWFIK